ncbi:NnrS family protein [Shewanella sp. KX20019]|uniref:NnrS family protein n=1 Tax=Shewanella sp. KX20019 TaxID=2803864 RepID=UPI0019288C39|nr:NnrS family protein [Shewanella sp. KX20019]QQX81050.1 NnrS family protein [Shewanella sp. KX20019]
MQSITEPKTKQVLSASGEVEQVALQPKNLFSQLSDMPLWDLAFRPWFLAAALSSVVSITLWILFLHGQFLGLATAGLSPVIWHIHEMLFGFAATIAVGFLLTAAQTWTNRRSINGFALMLLTVIWLLVRGLLWSSNPKLQLTAVALQASWWLISIGYIASMVIKAKSSRNYQFIPLLTAMMSFNIGFLLADIYGYSELALHLSRCAILLFCLLVGIVGGRVIPFFTGRGAENAKVKPTPKLDKCLPWVSLLGLAVFFINDFIELPFTAAPLLILAGVLHLLRILNWNSTATLKVPLLWSLHGSYFALAIGLIALGASYHIDVLRFADALHLITIGTIGAMILAMIARVSLGHTGRALKPHFSINIAFMLILIGALARVALPLLQQPILAWDISALCWIVAFGLFIWHYTTILFSARQS